MFWKKKKIEYLFKDYQKKKEEILDEIASWGYAFDALKHSEEFVEEKILCQAKHTLSALLEERMKFLKSDFYPIKIKSTSYLKSEDAQRAIEEMKRAVWVVLEMCLTCSKLTQNRVEKRIGEIIIEELNL